MFSLLAFSVFYSSNYYSSRFSTDVSYTSASQASSNISYLSGLERGFNALIDFSRFGLGFGFQQMSAELNQINGFYTNKLISLNSGILTNSYEGSFFLSKILVEFGFIGLIFSIWILFYYYRRLSCVSRNMSALGLLALSFCFSFLCYTFVRGGGYFSFPILLFLLSLSMFSSDNPEPRYFLYS